MTSEIQRVPVEEYVRNRQVEFKDDQSERIIAAIRQIKLRRAIEAMKEDNRDIGKYGRIG